VLPEGIQAFKWLRGKLAGEKPAVTRVVESNTGPEAAPVPTPAAAAPGPRSLGAAAANDAALATKAVNLAAPSELSTSYVEMRVAVATMAWEGREDAVPRIGRQIRS
jgi:hypothetical protein